jgi:hypothetical protein
VSKRESLYQSSGAQHPDARRAIPERKRSSRVERDRELFGFNPIANLSESGLSTAKVYLSVFLVTFVFALVESLWKHNLGLITSVPFFAVSVLTAFKVHHSNTWAGWTAPPLMYAAIAMLSVFITGQGLGGFPLAQLSGLVLTLMANTWAVLLTTGVCWILSRRIYIKHRNDIRRARREAAEID